MQKQHQQKKDKLIEIFKNQIQTGDIQDADIQEFVICNNIDQLKRLKDEYCLSDDIVNLVKQCLCLLDQAPKDPQPQKVQLPPFDPEPQIPTITQDMRTQYFDLKMNVDELLKIQQDFPQKIILIITFFIYIAENPLFKDFQTQFQTSKYNIQDITSYILRLQKSLKQYRVTTKQTDTEIQKIKGTSDLKAISSGLSRIEKQIVHVKIFKMLKLIQRSRQAGTKLNKKNGIVFIGRTGAGKTSSILYLLGHKMVKKEWNGQDWITPEKYFDDPGVEKLIATPSSVSVTANVNMIRLRQQMFLDGNTQQIYYLDTPGSGQTKGLHYDVANLYGIQAAVHALKTARFVILISGMDSGSRNQGIIQAIATLNELFPCYQRISASVVPFFNRFTDIQKLNATLRSIKKQIEQNKDSQQLTKMQMQNQNFRFILNDFINKTVDTTNISFNLLDPDLQNAKAMVNRILTAKPTDKLSSFCAAPSKKAQDALQKQTKQIEYFCINSFEKGNLKTCQYYLTLLKKVIQTLGSRDAPQFIKKSYKNIQETIQQSLNKKHDALVFQFSDKLIRNQITPEFITEFTQKINQFTEYQFLRKYIDIVDNKKRLEDCVKNKTQLLVATIKQNPKTMNVDKISSLVSLLTGLGNKKELNEIKEVYQEKQKQLQKVFIEQLQKRKYKDLDTLQTIKEYNIIEQVCSKLMDGNTNSHSILSIVLNHIEKVIKSVSNQVNNFESCGDEGYQKIKEISLRLQDFSLSYGMFKYFQTKQVFEKIENYRSSLQQKAGEKFKSMEDIFNDDSPMFIDKSKKIHKFYKQKDIMSQIPEIKDLVTRGFVAIDRGLIQHASTEKQELGSFVNQFLNGNIDYGYMKKKVKKLNNQLIKLKLKSQLYSQQFGKHNLIQVSQKVIEFFENLLKKFREISINFISRSKRNDQHIEKLKQLRDIFYVIDAFEDKPLLLRDEQDQNQKQSSVFVELKQLANSQFESNVTLLKKMIEDFNKYIEKEEFVVNERDLESAIDFIRIWGNVNIIDDKTKEFKEISNNFSQTMQKWIKKLNVDIKTLIKELDKKQQSQKSPRQVVKNIKRNLEYIERTSQKHDDIVKFQYDKEVDFPEQINSLYESYKKCFNSIQRTANNYSQFQNILIKCRAFCAFDQYLSVAKQNFENLVQKASVETERLSQNLDDKFFSAYQNNNYVEAIRNYKAAKDSQKNPEVVEKIETKLTQFLTSSLQIFKSQIRTNGITLNQELQGALSVLNELFNVTKAIKQLKIVLTGDLSNINNQVEKTINEKLIQINNQYQKLANDIITSIQTQNIQNNSIKIERLELVEKWIKEILNVKTRQTSLSLKTQIHDEINKLLKRFSSQKDVKVNEIVSVYNLHNLNKITSKQSNQLHNLKKTIIQKIKTQINNQKSIILDEKILLLSRQEQLKQFIAMLPQQIKMLPQFVTFNSEFQKKKGSYIQQVSLMNNTIINCQVIQNKHLNLEIINFYKHEAADEQKINIISQKINEYYSNKIKDSRVKGLGELLDLTESTEFYSLQQRQLKNTQKTTTALAQNERLNRLEIIINNNHKLLLKTIRQNFEREMRLFERKIKSESEGTSISPRASIRQSVIFSNLSFSQNIFNLAQFFNSTSDSKNPLRNQAQKMLNESLKQFLNELTTYFSDQLTKLNKLQQILAMPNPASYLSDKLVIVKKIHVFENFLSECRGERQKYQCNNSLFELLDTSATSINNITVRAGYKQKLTKFLQEKIKEMAVYSICKIDFQTMDTNSMERTLDQMHSQMKQLTPILITISDILGQNVKEINQQLHKLQKMPQILKDEASYMIGQILKYSKDPIFTQEQIEKISQKKVILQKYSKFDKKIKESLQAYEDKLKQTHVAYLDRCNSILKKIIKMQQTHKANVVKFDLTYKIIDIDDRKKEREKAQEEIIKLKSQLDRQLAIQQEEDKKQNMKKKHQGQSLDLKNKATTIIDEKLAELIDQKEKEKRKFTDDLIVESDSLAGTFEKIINITSELLPVRQLEQKNEFFVKQVKRQGKALVINHFGNSLNKLGTQAAGIAIQRYNQFKGCSDIAFKSNIKAITPSQLINQLANINVHIKENGLYRQLENNYNFLMEDYKMKINDFKHTRNKDNLLKQINNSKYKNNDDCINEDNIRLLSSLLALWTLLSIQDEDGQIKCQYQMHPAQTITLMLLLGLPNCAGCQDLKNRLAEVKTGQGKSLIIGVLSCYLSIKGFSIRCVCYSKFLSQRDEYTFKQMFKVLRVEDKVKYCTFNELVEIFIKNKEINLRQSCTKICYQQKTSNGMMTTLKNIVTKPFQKDYQEVDRDNSILIIDEVDAFFHPDFYGNTYTPSIDLRSESIKILMNLIWNKKGQQRQLRQLIKNSAELKKVKEDFPEFEKLIDNKIGSMIRGVANYIHPYLIKDGKIAYKDQDGYSTNISFGYKTLFAYFNQYEKGNISELPDDVSSMEISLCEVSFAELPKMYKYILGVTGTLQNLSKQQKEIMSKQYSIQQKDNFYIPSIYQDAKRDDKGYTFVPQQRHYDSVIENIKQTTQAVKDKPILIFFDSLQDINNFLQYQGFIPYQHKVGILNQNHNQQERKRAIQRSMCKGKITLITKSFMRGTDFVVYQKAVIETGVHMIIACVIQQKSQEIQALGRVGRKGQTCSSCFIVSSRSLEDKLKLKQTDLNNLNQKQIQIKIDQAREKIMNSKQQILKQAVQKSFEKHKKAKELVQNIQNSKRAEVLAYLIERNLVPVLHQQSVKSVLAIDGTASMSSVMERTKQVLQQAFVRIYRILQLKGVENSFQMQILIYRNYDSTQDLLLQTTAFEFSPQNLVQFIKTIKVNGGWGNQAIQVAFNYCSGIKDLKQIILIGDAAANTKEQTVQKRNETTKTQNYWAKSSFPTPLNINQQLNKLIASKVFIQTLPILRAQTEFKSYSALSGGMSQAFDPTSSTATKQLTDFISKCILGNLGDSNTSRQLVDLYIKTYK